MDLPFQRLTETWTGTCDWHTDGSRIDLQSRTNPCQGSKDLCRMLRHDDGGGDTVGNDVQLLLLL